MKMATYARAVRDSVGESGLTAMLTNEIPLPGLKEPRSQLAVPLRARGRVLGALFVESLHDQYFGYDDEDALMLLGGQFAVAMSLMQPPEQEPPGQVAARPAAPVDAGPPLRLKRFGRDNSVFLDDVYLIRGVAGAILWKLVSEFLRSGRREFTNRELRLAPEVETALFRMVQEALTNVVKHARVTRATVVLEADARELRLIIADQGIGFEPAEQARVSEQLNLGLVGMRERVEAVGGSLRLESAPGQGTRVVAEVKR